MILFSMKCTLFGINPLNRATHGASIYVASSRVKLHGRHGKIDVKDALPEDMGKMFRVLI